MARRLTLNLDTPAFQSALPQAPVLKNWRELLIDTEAARFATRDALTRIACSRHPTRLNCRYNAAHSTVSNLAPLALITNLAARLLIPTHETSRIWLNRFLDSWAFVPCGMGDARMILGWQPNRDDPTREEHCIDDVRLRSMSQMEFVQHFQANQMLQIYSLLQATHYLVPDTRPATDGIDCYLAPGGFYLLMSILKQEMHSIG